MTTIPQGDKLNQKAVLPGVSEAAHLTSTQKGIAGTQAGEAATSEKKDAYPDRDRYDTIKIDEIDKFIMDGPIIDKAKQGGSELTKQDLEFVGDQALGEARKNLFVCHREAFGPPM